LYGSNTKDERTAALRMLDPRTAPKGPGLLVGTLGTGSKGLNLTAAHTMIYLSYDHSLEKFLQGNDRVHRPGQVHPVSYYDIIATGPKGQKTIDHHIIQSRYNKDSLATWTVSAWQRALSEE
jgi:SNF2 family DNA or RNA helicase